MPALVEEPFFLLAFHSRPLNRQCAGGGGRGAQGSVLVFLSVSRSGPVVWFPLFNKGGGERSQGPTQHGDSSTLCLRMPGDCQNCRFLIPAPPGSDFLVWERTRKQNPHPSWHLPPNWVSPGDCVWTVLDPILRNLPLRPVPYKLDLRVHELEGVWDVQKRALTIELDENERWCGTDCDIGIHNKI